MMNRSELSKQITAIENRDPKALKSLSKIFNANSLRKTICFTGPAGVGKSTLVSQLALEASLAQKIAWLACDPSSPETGGSLLGDRIRLSQDAANDRLFVRSLSTRGTFAFSRAIRDIEIYLENTFDQIWVETAGSGQTQSEVARLSALTVLILQPETGDEVQWMKSGVRDWVDLFVVNKSDLPGAELMAQSLKENGAAGDRILLTSSKRAKGLGELLTKLRQMLDDLSWRSRGRILHREHARALYIECASQKLEQEFAKKSDRLMRNPYRSFY